MRLPKSWAEVPLKKYIEISELSLVDMDEIDKAVKILSVLSGWTEDEISELSVKKIAEYTKQVRFIYSYPKTKGIPTYVWVKGKKFYLNNDLKRIKGAEYIDLVSFCKEKEKVASRLPEILAIFFEPVNWFGFRKRGCYKKNKEGEYIQTTDSRIRTAEILMDLPADKAMALS